MDVQLSLSRDRQAPPFFFLHVFLCRIEQVSTLFPFLRPGCPPGRSTFYLSLCVFRTPIPPFLPVYSPSLFSFTSALGLRLVSYPLFNSLRFDKPFVKRLSSLVRKWAQVLLCTKLPTFALTTPSLRVALPPFSLQSISLVGVNGLRFSEDDIKLSLFSPLSSAPFLDDVAPSFWGTNERNGGDRSVFLFLPLFPFFPFPLIDLSTSPDISSAPSV